MKESIFMMLQDAGAEGLMEVVKDCPWLLHTQSGTISEECELQALCEGITRRMSDKRLVQVKSRMKHAYMDQFFNEGCRDSNEMCDKLGIKPEDIMEPGPFPYAEEYTYAFGLEYETRKRQGREWTYMFSNEAFDQGVEDAKELCNLLGI